MLTKFNIYREVGGGGGGGTGTGAGTGQGQGGNTDHGGQPNEPDYKSLSAKLQAETAIKLEEAGKQYSGLQKVLTKEQETHKVTKDALAALTEKSTVLEAQFQDLTGKHTAVSTKLSELETQNKGLSGFKARMTLIIEKYPELAPFEAKGLLPVAEEGKMDEVFKTFSDQLAHMSEQARIDFKSGLTPPKPGGEGELTPAQIADGFLKAANNAALKGDQKGYQENYDKYITAKAKIPVNK